MNAFQVQIVVLLLSSLWLDAFGTKSSEQLSIVSIQLKFNNNIEQIADSFEKNDSQKTTELLKFLETRRINEFNDQDFVSTDPEYVLNRIAAEGFPVQDHEIVTDDRYILHLYRLPHGREVPITNSTRPPVLIMHGLYAFAESWINLGSKYSLGYMLADAGYDVWLANARGSEPSRAHEYLPTTGPRQKEYWSFSWHEIGVYDLPAMIDHILAKTNQKKLNYVGYSQGTTVFLVMASMRPDYNNKIIDSHLMAPVTSLEDIKGLDTLARFYTPLKKTAEIMHIYKVTSDGNTITKATDRFCDRFKIDCAFTSVLESKRGGGGSLRQSFHYLQTVRNGGFKLFDFDDKKKNKEIYGEETPPLYNLTQIKAPVSLYYSKGDVLATKKNAIRLKYQLPNLRSFYEIPIDGFNHDDFIDSLQVREAVNNKLISNMGLANGF